MNGAKERKALLPERGVAWVVTFLLTVLLAVAVLSTMTVRALTSAGLHLRVATDDGVLDDQLCRIYAYIDLLAEEYGFSAEAVKETVTREELAEMNRKAAAWWTRLLTDGEMDSFPRWYSGDIEDTVYAGMGEDDPAADPQTVVTDLTNRIERTVFPMRETLLTIGMNLAEDKADLPGILRSLRKIPLLALTLSLLAAGVIALLLGRESVRCLKHYGTAAAGAGLAILSAGIIMTTVSLKTILEQASAGLAAKFGSLALKTGLETGAVMLALIVIGYFCLYLYRKKTGRKNETVQVQTE